MALVVSLEDKKKYALEYLYSMLRMNCPKETTNLAQNGIVNVSGVYIGIGGEVAPYAPYTNEPWISDKWNGRKNPNEGWIENTIKQCMPYIRQLYSGQLAEEDVLQHIQTANDNFDRQIEAMTKQIEGGK